MPARGFVAHVTVAVQAAGSSSAHGIVRASGTAGVAEGSSVNANAACVTTPVPSKFSKDGRLATFGTRTEPEPVTVAARKSA